jgi:hypothetical protein
VLELALHEGALRKSGAEEGSVDADEDPRTSGEHDSGEQEPAPEEDLEEGHEPHGCVVVFLDELADVISQRVGFGGGLASGGGGGDLLRWLESWNQICAGVGRNVEHGVHAKREHGQRVLGSKEPYECHGCEGGFSKRSNHGTLPEEENLPKYWTFSSATIERMLC